MSGPTRWLIGAAFSCGLVISAGCEERGGVGEPDPPVVISLKEVADMLRAAGASKAPEKVADLAKSGAFYSRGYEAVKSGEIEIVWGAEMAGEGDAASGTGPKGVIAYEKKAPTEGGHVLLQDGTVQEMTADEFKAAPKAA